MTNANVKTIDVHALKNLYDATPDLCLIDVRENDEWQETHIPRALHIPKDTLISVINHHVLNHKCPIYLHCRGGVRSLHAANCLAEMGYQDVYSVDGGITAWVNAGYPVEP